MHGKILYIHLLSNPWNSRRFPSPHSNYSIWFLQQASVLIADLKRTRGLQEIAWLPRQLLRPAHLSWQRKETLSRHPKKQMSTPSVLSAWRTPKMPHLFTATLGTAAAAGPVHKSWSKGGTHAPFAGRLLSTWLDSLMLEEQCYPGQWVGAYHWMLALFK